MELTLGLSKDYFSDNGSEVDISISFLGVLFGSSFNRVIPKSSLPKTKKTIAKIKNAAIANKGNM